MSGITYPISMPVSAARFVQARISIESVVGLAPSQFTYQSQVQVHPGQRWRLQISIAPMRGRDFLDWLGWFGALNGREGTFLAFDTAICKPFGVATGVPLVDGSGIPAMSRTLPTKGWTPNIAGIMKRGDRFQIGTGSSARLYMVTKDADSDSSGEVTLDIWPGLRLQPENNAPIILSNPKSVFRLASNDQSFERSGGRYTVTIDAIEAL